MCEALCGSTCNAGATDIITANTEVATEMGSQLLQYLGANANGVRVLVRELRKQMDNHVIELAEELASDKQHQPKDPDGYVYKVDQSLLSSAVEPAPPPAATSVEALCLTPLSACFKLSWPC